MSRWLGRCLPRFRTLLPHFLRRCRFILRVLLNPCPNNQSHNNHPPLTPLFHHRRALQTSKLCRCVGFGNREDVPRPRFVRFGTFKHSSSLIPAALRSAAGSTCLFAEPQLCAFVDVFCFEWTFSAHSLGAPVTFGFDSADCTVTYGFAHG